MKNYITLIRNAILKRNSKPKKEPYQRVASLDSKRSLIYLINRRKAG
jgi:hypothetical protein